MPKGLDISRTGQQVNINLRDINFLCYSLKLPVVCMIYFFASLGLFLYPTEAPREQRCSDGGILQLMAPPLWTVVPWTGSESLEPGCCVPFQCPLPP